MTIATLSHGFAIFLMPPGLNCLLLLFGLIFYFFWRKFAMFLIGISLIILWMFSSPYIVYHMLDWLQNQYPILTEQEIQNPKPNYAIVVLGGGDQIAAEYHYKHIVSNFTWHRVKYAAFLKQKTNLPLIVSGGSDGIGRSSEAELMANQLHEEFNIEPTYYENKSSNTADESKYVLDILKANHIDGIYLVTNAWHMPRSVYIFKCAGIKVIPAPMGHYVYDSYAVISFLPNMEAFHASSVVLHELVGLFWYRVYYGGSCKSAVE